MKKQEVAAKAAMNEILVPTMETETSVVNTKAVNNTDPRINFEELFSPEEDDGEELSTEILQSQIDEIKAYLSSAYDRVYLSFHQQKGVLFIKLTKQMGHSKFSAAPLWSAADRDLCFAVMNAFRGKFELLDNYSIEGRKPEYSEKNLVIEYFKEFLNSKLRIRVGRDYIPEDEKILKKYTIHLSKTGLVKFCLEDTEELRALLQTV